MEHYRGEPVLIPRKDSLIKQCIAVAERIPGADWDEGGQVGGARHALLSCLELSGQGADWSPMVLDTSNPANELELPEFQRYGAGVSFRNADVGLLNNDDVGLGKTVQTIAAASLLDAEFCKVVLCPSFLKQQWAGEVKRWAPLFRRKHDPVVHVIWPKGDKRSQKAAPLDAEWVIAYYLDAERAIDLVGNRPYLLVADEIHNVRGYKTQRLESLTAASTFASARLGLTASPMYNDPAGIYPALQLIQPGYWGNFYSFAKRYCGASDGAYGMVLGKKLTHGEELRRRMSTMSFRRTRQDVFDQLPFDTKFHTVWLEMPGVASTRIRAALVSASVLQQQYEQTVAFKSPRVVEYIQGDIGAGVPSITFSWTRAQAQAISAALPGSMLVLGGSGSTLRLSRISEYVARSKSQGIAPHVVGTYDALGEGANLQWAKVVNLASLDYTPDKVKQAVGRAARMGQEGEVLVRLFVVKNTLDEHMVAVARAKLGEQFKLDGRKEKDKAALDEALLGTGAVKNALQRMYEKALKEEQAHGD